MLGLKVPDDTTALILAGGRSQRMGTDKALLPWGEFTLLEFLVNRLRPVFASVCVVTKDPEKYKGLPARVVADAFPEHSAMVGLYSGLVASETEINFVIPCDAPLIPVSLIQDMAEGVASAAAVVLGFGPVDSPLPFPGFYRQSVVPELSKKIASREYTMWKFLRECVCLSIPETTWRDLDPHGYSLINLNTKEDYDKACLAGLPIQIGAR